MKRFLTTTAIALTLSGAAMAQSGMTGFGDVQMQEGDFYASDLIGMRIYNAETPVEAGMQIADGGEAEWDDIGEINDIILSQDGQVSAVILGVGGVMGAGERDVAVSMDAITVVNEEGDSDDRFLVVSTSQEVLEAAPEYERAAEGTVYGDPNAETAAPATDPAMQAENPANGAPQEGGMVDETMNEGAHSSADMATNDPATRDMLTRPMVEREGYTEADMATVSQMTADGLEGVTVYGPQDESVGDINSLVLSDDGKIETVVVNVGGFLGMGEKSVGVTFDELQILTQDDGDDYRIYIDSTVEALKAQPEFDVK
ncbi:PRC-barrel domain-containing protein [Albirhodobacter sp. R86504]|uniref:PRC-barrel domain-containing protein n=1 Tax=Albirhodobacter sp. R86504 TaxID=3093848 RepID=UPI00366F1B9F